MKLKWYVSLLGKIDGTFKRIVHNPPLETVIDPNGCHRPRTNRTGLAEDGEPFCDRCEDGKLLSCMDPCRCGRVG